MNVQLSHCRCFSLIHHSYVWCSKVRFFNLICHMAHVIPLVILSSGLFPILLNGIKSSPDDLENCHAHCGGTALLEGGACTLLLDWLCCSPDCLGVNVNQGRGLDSPLHAVARASSGELVSLLLDFGADTQARNAEGKRPLELVPPESPLRQLLQREGASPLPKSKP